MGCRNIIGVTGGIACGKTLVCGLFERLGIRVFDADEIARELVEPGQQAFNEIVNCFGEEILNQNGHLDRPQLRKKIFLNNQLRKQLENILHPRIYTCMNQRAMLLNNIDYCIFCIPLLVETQKLHMVNRVLVVDCDTKIQRQRLHKRDKTNFQEIEKILNAQVNRQTRLAFADDIIKNNKHNYLDELEKKVKTLHLYYSCFI